MCGRGGAMRSGLRFIRAEICLSETHTQTYICIHIDFSSHRQSSRTSMALTWGNPHKQPTGPSQRIHAHSKALKTSQWP